MKKGRQITKFRIDEMADAIIDFMVLNGKPATKKEIAREVSENLHHARQRKWTIEQDEKYILNNWIEINRLVRFREVYLAPMGKWGLYPVTRRKWQEFREKCLIGHMKSHNRMVSILRRQGFFDAKYMALAYDDCLNFEIVEVDRDPYAEEK